MTNKGLCSSIKNIGCGYIFLHISINLNTIDLLPDWVAYAFFIQALPILGEEEESANLLKPLGIILAVLEVLFWVNKGFLGSGLPLGIVGVVSSVISLYFHFQLLTNLAEIAHKYGCSQEKKLLTLRTVKTILTTVLTIIYSFWITSQITLGIAVVTLIVTIWICKVIFSFANELEVMV